MVVAVAIKRWHGDTVGFSSGGIIRARDHLRYLGKARSSAAACCWPRSPARPRSRSRPSPRCRGPRSPRARRWSQCCPGNTSPRCCHRPPSRRSQSTPTRSCPPALPENRGTDWCWFVGLMYSMFVLASTKIPCTDVILEVCWDRDGVYWYSVSGSISDTFSTPASSIVRCVQKTTKSCRAQILARIIWRMLHNKKVLDYLIYQGNGFR